MTKLEREDTVGATRRYPKFSSELLVYLELLEYLHTYYISKEFEYVIDTVLRIIFFRETSKIKINNLYVGYLFTEHTTPDISQTTIFIIFLTTLLKFFTKCFDRREW